MIKIFNIKNIISIKDFERADIDYILDEASKLENIAKSREVCEDLKGKILGLMFFEPSTRTRMSFETALKYLKKFYTGTKEQKLFVNNLLIHMQTTPKRYEKLNVEDYTLNKFCLIDRVRDYFDYEKFLPALEELK